MKLEVLIKIAHDADPFGEHGNLYKLASLTPEVIERFAHLVAAAEREQCAKVCDETIKSGDWDLIDGAEVCAEAIRARCIT